ncbi:MAG: LamG-like jellyroll fold domain-containing protein, partial [Halanaerobiales bacterium]
MMKEYKKISQFILYLLLIFIISLNSKALPEPEAWLKFDGNTADCTGNGYHGIPDSPQQFTEDFDQNTNSAYHFSSGQNISLGDKFNMDTVNFTITLWFKTDKEMSSTMQLVGKTNDTYYISPGGQGFFLGLRQYSGVDRVITQVRGDNGAREMYSPEIDETRWHFVALRRGTGSLSLFVDGHEPIVNDLSAGSISSPGTEFSIGRDAGWQGSFVGAMDDLRIYKEALTDEEINEIYKEGWPSDFPPYLNSISTSTERGQAPLTVDLSAETEDFDDETLYYTWDFGDGNISTESPSHIYQNPGVYTVSLTVSDDEGRDDSASISIRVDGDNSGVIHAASCSYQDVSAAVAAADPGETVRVPAGEAVWEKRLELGKSIRLIGAGIDRTTLINGIQSDGTNDYIIKITPENPEEDPFIEVAGFTLDANKEGGAVSISSTDDEYPYYNFRVHHNKIMNGYDTGQSYMAVRVKGNCFGLIDHNILLNNLRDFKLYGDDKNSWDKFPGVDNIGSRNYLYIENNKSERYISFPGQEFTVTSGEGSRWVFRYNQLDLTVRGFGTFDAHGNTNNNGVVAHEIYENTIVNAQDR